MKQTFISALCTLLTFSPCAFAADDPSIKDPARSEVQASMKKHVDDLTVDGTYHIYDPTVGRLHRLKFDKLHEGIVKKADFYVSCADFTDASGKKFDLDFLVLRDGENFKIADAVVHAVDGEKRPYQLESK
jgi:hypothetical protein